MAGVQPRAVALTIQGQIARSDVVALCDDACALLERAGATLAIVDLGSARADAVTVDALARLKLAARRRGCAISFRNVPGELRALLAWSGLTDVLGDQAAAAARTAGTDARCPGRT